MQIVDLFTFNRRISAKLSAVLIKTAFTPNHVTTLSMGSGLWAGYFFSTGSRRGMLFGAIFLQLSFILDNCDGDIARAKKMQSKFGMWYDFAADLAVDFALWTGLAIGAVTLDVPGASVRWWWMGAMIGSAVNFARVVGRRLAEIRAARGASEKIPPPPNKSTAETILYVLGQDGDPTLFVYIFMLIGSPWLFLVSGAVYINALWLLSWRQKAGPS